MLVAQRRLGEGQVMHRGIGGIEPCRDAERLGMELLQSVHLIRSCDAALWTHREAKEIVPLFVLPVEELLCPIWILLQVLKAFSPTVAP